jgi:5-methylcytosine-specific restriction protein A
MPQRPQKPCNAQGCNALTRNARYCDDHAYLDKPWFGRKGSGRGGRPWRRLRDLVLRRDHFICHCDECKALDRIRPAHEVDHIVAVAEGGTDEPSNLRAINHDCHELKTRRESQAGMARRTVQNA